jgi:hypothetical protein
VKRDLAIDHLRSGITVAVVAHHAALAFNTFCRYDPVHYTRSTAPVVDRVRFAPLDYFVAWNDIFFMALMFLISGLFVAPALARKGPSRFLADQAKRLGIPFAIAVTLLMPLAYYPSWHLSNDAARGGYLRRFFTTDGWPVGPPWFLWLLLAFCAVAFCAVATLAAWLVPRVWNMLSWPATSPGGLAAACLAVSLLATTPVRFFASPYAWSSLGGPFAFQTARLPLYFAWFLLGVSLGGENLRSLSAPASGPGRSGFSWVWQDSWRTGFSLEAHFYVACQPGRQRWSWRLLPLLQLHQPWFARNVPQVRALQARMGRQPLDECVWHLCRSLPLRDLATVPAALAPVAGSGQVWRGVFSCLVG